MPRNTLSRIKIFVCVCIVGVCVCTWMYLYVAMLGGYKRVLDLLSWSTGSCKPPDLWVLGIEFFYPLQDLSGLSIP